MSWAIQAHISLRMWEEVRERAEVVIVRAWRVAMWGGGEGVRVGGGEGDGEGDGE